jgi:hypothetical protein
VAGSASDNRATNCYGLTARKGGVRGEFNKKL